MRRFWYSLILVLGLAPGRVAPLRGQDAAMGDRAPRFLMSAATGAMPIDIVRTAALRRRISLALRDVPLGQALETIARESGIRLGYSRAVVPVDRVVRLVAEDITVAGALSEVLFDTGVDVLFERGGQAAAIVRRAAKSGRVETGTIAGRVTDAKTGEPIVGAEVFLEGSRVRGASGEKGYYRLTDVEAGNYTLTARRVGYAKQSRAVVVTGGQELAVDVALQPVVTQLNELVTTVTGEQRRLELGHVVGVINADSIVKEAPISSVSELLTGRVPGLQVSQAQGTVGGTVKLQVRGQNSILLKNEPIIVIDGIRYASSAVPIVVGYGPAGAEATSPLNDLNPNDIESVEVVKGPSAATLYGTDASNGVIVIKTKRGQPGAARWNAYAKGSRNNIPHLDYPDNYWGWGTAFGVANKYNCSIAFVLLGYCSGQDSISVIPNPLNDPRNTIFGPAPRYEYGMNVAGGRQDVRYYFSVGLEQATGPIQMPKASLERLIEQRGSVPEEFKHPNTLDNVNLRANVSARFSDRGEVTVNAGYIRGSTRTLTTNNPYANGLATSDPYDAYGTRYGARPEDIFASQSTEKTDRFVGNTTGQWRPWSWLSSRATVGLDVGSRNRGSLLRSGDATGSPHPFGTPSDFIDGTVGDNRGREVAMTADANVSARYHRNRWSGRTAVGAQYVRTLLDVLSSFGQGLPPGGSSISEASYVTTGQSYNETVTLGSYIEQTIGFNDRLFLIGAVRVDGASTFGRNYDAAAYPKFSASWLASQEPFFPRVPGLDELRLRYAYGASGQQPEPAWSRPSYVAASGIVNGAPGTVIEIRGIGNPGIRPERVREHEIGFDATGFGSRVQLGLTWYKRRTVDQIVGAVLPSGFGYVNTNLGVTTQHGFELELVAHLLDTPALSWDLIAQHALHRTKIVDIGGAFEERSYSGGYVEGYPIGARFLPAIVYADTNGNGTIDAAYPYGELQVRRDLATYAGESTPPSTQTLTAAFGLFNRRLRVSTLFERRAGFTQVNSLRTSQCAYSGRCRGVVDPTTPLDEQAQAVAAQQSYWAYLERGDFTRLREVTLAADLPMSVVRALRARSATISMSGRNLALWTDFSAGDPESVEQGFNQSTSGGGVPQGRTWTLRVDLGF